jgi:hypothetical protein
VARVVVTEFQVLPRAIFGENPDWLEVRGFAGGLRVVIETLEVIEGAV